MLLLCAQPSFSAPRALLAAPPRGPPEGRIAAHKVDQQQQVGCVDGWRACAVLHSHHALAHNQHTVQAVTRLRTRTVQGMRGQEDVCVCVWAAVVRGRRGA
jgi:hypothetical protein